MLYSVQCALLIWYIAVGTVLLYGFLCTMSSSYTNLGMSQQHHISQQAYYSYYHDLTYWRIKYHIICLKNLNMIFPAERFVVVSLKCDSRQKIHGLNKPRIVV